MYYFLTSLSSNLKLQICYNQKQRNLVEGNFEVIVERGSRQLNMIRGAERSQHWRLQIW